MSLCVGIELSGDSLRAAVLGGPPGTPDRLVVPAAVLIRPSGELVVGDRILGGGDGELYRDFGDRVGDPVPVIGSHGGARLGADLVALTLSALLWRTTAGLRPDHVTIAHPTSWGRYQSSVLRSALTTTWVDAVPTTLVSTALAATSTAEQAGALSPGEAVLVVDIGGEHTELTVVVGGGDRPRYCTATSTVDELGASRLDRALAAYLLAQLPTRVDPHEPATRAAVRELVARVRIARAELVDQPATVVPVRLPSGTHQLRVVRGEFDELVEESISCAVSAIVRMIREAHENGIEITAALLTGEPARTPLLAERLSDRITVFPPDPEWTIALGAAEIAAARVTAATITARAEAVSTIAWAEATDRSPRSAMRDAGRGRSRFRDAAVSAAAGFAVLAAGGAASHLLGGATQGDHVTGPSGHAAGLGRNVGA